jgi:hypothetical protein
LIQSKIRVLADDLYVAVGEEEVCVADVWSGDVAVISKWTVGDVAGLKQTAGFHFKILSRLTFDACSANLWNWAVFFSGFAAVPLQEFFDDV